MKYIDAVIAAGFRGSIARKAWDGYCIWAPYQEYLMGMDITPLWPCDADETDWVVVDCLSLE